MSDPTDAARAALIEQIHWDERGLAPAIVQDDLTGQVLMMAYMNREALEKTLESGQAHFWSRSRQELWHKGANSGHTQAVRAVHLDCDGDTLLLLVDPAGPACHTGERTCFYRRLDGESDQEAQPFRGRLTSLLQDRRRHPKPGSYTCQMLDAAPSRLYKKVGEEAIETIVAAESETDERLASEAADLTYHLTLLLVRHGLSGEDVDRELRDRYAH